MKKGALFTGMLVMVLAFGMSVVGCDNGSTNVGNIVPKTLVIQMPATVFAYGESGFMIGVFPVGTTNEQALNNVGIVAGIAFYDPGWSYAGTDPISLTAPLFDVATGARWIGGGTYDVLAILFGGGGRYFRASSVNINSAITNIAWSSITEVFP